MEGKARCGMARQWETVGGIGGGQGKANQRMNGVVWLDLSYFTCFTLFACSRGDQVTIRPIDRLVRSVNRQIDSETRHVDIQASRYVGN